MPMTRIFKFRNRAIFLDLFARSLLKQSVKLTTVGNGDYLTV